MAIRVLPPPVADAIAAGEVVERPASVVKELVENSLDAGARRIAVEIRGAGRTLIRVADDGAGISADELQLAFQRHATSKVSSLEDLAAISTLGFRGEALASIAAVSDVECRSGGARLRLRGGEVVEEGPAISVPGTVVEVRDLFAHTPARLKFLKSEAVEQANCLRTLQAYALLYPEVRFEVRLEGRWALRTPGDGDARAAAAAVWGQAVAGELLAVEGEGIRGFVSQPRLSRGNRDWLLLAVNRRPAVSRTLTYAVEECYLGRLERDRHPVCVLDLQLPPAEVDVNVHPAKREVRFRSERVVFAALQRAVRAALGESQPYRLAPTPEPGWQAPRVREAAAPLLPAPTRPAPVVEGALLRPLGQVQDGYLVAEGQDGVVLIDQHAAHERVLYNRFLARLERRSLSGTASQALLVPEVLEVGAREAAAAVEQAERLEALGFRVEPFGPGAVRLLAAPAEMAADRAPAALRELLEVLAEGRPEETLVRAAALVACHAAVRFGDRLETSEQRRLLAELEVAQESVTCPHGRPTRLVIGWADLKRHFRRTY